MIRVSKPVIAPAALSPGAGLVQSLIDDAAGGIRSGASNEPFAFDRGVYAHASVKAALRAAQFDKCCYCEGKIGAHSAGDVEHFRPKTRTRQGPNEVLVYPGYYWLAYQWANLFFACDQCNRVGKRDFFPLGVPANRARLPTDSLAIEEPMLVDPSADDPRAHIRFNTWIPEGQSERGRETIRIVGLDRDALNDDRRSHYKIIDVLAQLLALPELENDRAAAKALLLDFSGPTAQYSAMTNDCLAAHGISQAELQ